MKTVLRRLSKLEQIRPRQDSPFRSPAEVLMERRSRRIALEEGRPYEEVHEQQQRESAERRESFNRSYRSDGAPASVLLHLRMERNAARQEPGQQLSIPA